MECLYDSGSCGSLGMSQWPKQSLNDVDDSSCYLDRRVNRRGAAVWHIDR